MDSGAPTPFPHDVFHLVLGFIMTMIRNNFSCCKKQLLYDLNIFLRKKKFIQFSASQTARTLDLRQQ